MSRRQPTRQESRTKRCPKCAASPGHPCVEVRTTGQYGKRVGEVRETVHEQRVESFKHGR